MPDQPASHAEVARATAARIRKHPGAYDQRDYFMMTLVDSDRRIVYSGRVDVLVHAGTSAAEWEACGTTACCAGHAVAAGIELGRSPMRRSIEECAADFLGLDVRRSLWLFSEQRERYEVLAELDNIATAGQLF